MRAKLSIAAIYNYDPTIFNNLLVPSTVLADDVIAAIIAEAAELNTRYPDASVLKTMIGVWSRRKYPIWAKIAKLIKLDYNPIENYDRIEEWTDGANSSATASSSGINSSTAYNSNQFVDNGKSTSTSNSAATSEGKHSGRTHGNIGVTTVAQMMQGELDTLPKLDVISVIVNDFLDAFCIGIY